MKKIFVLLSVLLIGGISFSQEKDCGIDITLGTSFGFNYGKTKLLGIEYKDKWQDTSFEIKINSYDLFALNNHLGIYASFGYKLGTKHDEKVSANGIETEYNDSFFNQEIELFIGPAFGFDLGKNRFQMGIAYHSLFGNAKGKVNKTDAFDKATAHYYQMGFALTPQFRFGIERRLSFVFGIDFTFDFAYKQAWVYEYNDGSDKRFGTYFPDSSFRFGMTPYIALGINF